MKAFYCDHHELPIASRSRFPINKYRDLRERLSAQAELALEFAESPPVSEAVLLAAHSQHYIDKVFKGTLSREEQRLIGFDWSTQLVLRSRCSAGGTLAACRAALSNGAAVNLAGGTHHAKRSSGAGYCVFNDVAVAARNLSLSGLAQRVLIVDTDVHQGDGTAEILAPYPSLYTFSMHGERNFPRRKTTSNLDISMADGVGDEEYLDVFTAALSRAFVAAAPQFVIYLSGADPYVDDRLGRLALSKAGLKRRDEHLFAMCREHAVPVATVMGGGYAKDITDIVDIYAQTVTAAAANFSALEESS